MGKIPADYTQPWPNMFFSGYVLCDVIYIGPGFGDNVGAYSYIYWGA